MKLFISLVKQVANFTPILFNLFHYCCHQYLFLYWPRDLFSNAARSRVHTSSLFIFVCKWHTLDSLHYYNYNEFGSCNPTINVAGRVHPETLFKARYFISLWRCILGWGGEFFHFQYKSCQDRWVSGRFSNTCPYCLCGFTEEFK